MIGNDVFAVDKKTAMRTDKVRILTYLIFPIFERLGCEDFISISKLYGCIVAVCLHHDDVVEAHIPYGATFFDDDGVSAGLSDL